MKSLVSKSVKEDLVAKKLAIVNSEVPVLVIFEGGSGRVISKVVNELDRIMEPRGVSYWHFDVDASPSKSLARMLQATPAKSQISMFDRSWYSLAVNKYEGGQEQLAAELETPFDVDGAFREFYNTFDLTFLQLFPTFVEESAILYDRILFSAGKIGYQVELPPDELAKLTPFQYADLCE